MDVGQDFQLICWDMTFWEMRIIILNQDPHNYGHTLHSGGHHIFHFLKKKFLGFPKKCLSYVGEIFSRWFEVLFCRPLLGGGVASEASLQETFGVCCVMGDCFMGISIHSPCKGAGVCLSEKFSVVGHIFGGPESCC